jgi:hypothetical protein
VRPPPADGAARGWSEGSGGRAASPWGLTLHLQGILISGGRGDRANLGGIGASGRYALHPVVTLDLGFDAVAGTDYNGYDRSELALAFSSLFFLNEHPLLRAYVLIGINASRARVDVARDDQIWGYFGGHTGLGVEFTIDPRVALSLDVLGFMRGRTDSRAEREPEFTDSAGRVTNTSGGGLLRAGIILHF